MLIADVAYPALLEPYLAAVFVPWAGLAGLLAEIAVFAFWYGASVRLTLIVVAANAVSCGVGWCLGLVIPSALIFSESPPYAAWWAWCVAFLLRIAIEYFVIARATGRHKLH